MHFALVVFFFVSLPFRGDFGLTTTFWLSDSDNIFVLFTLALVWFLFYFQGPLIESRETLDRLDALEREIRDSNDTRAASSEDQRVMRLLRPDQTEQVNVTYLHLRGSIDEYMAQIVEWKKDSAAVGLDYSDSDVSEDDFLHLDTILSRFCEDVKRLSLRDLLMDAA